MKHPKWLLVIVIVLLAINVLFYSLWYALDVKDIIKSRLETFLSQTLDGNFYIEKISLNERLITVNNVSFINGSSDIRASVKQIQVRYDLLRIIFSGFKIDKSIKQITVFEPDIYLKIQPKQEKSNKKPFEIPSLKPYFDEVDIKGGKLHFVFSNMIADTLSIYAEEILRDIAIKVSNENETSLSLSAITQNNGSVKLTSELKHGLLTQINARIDNFKPYILNINGFDNLSTELTAVGSYTKADKDSETEYEINSVLRNTVAEYDKYRLLAPYIHIQGNQNILQYAVRPSEINKHKLSASGFIRDILKHPYISSSVDIQNIDLVDITPELDGSATGKLEVNGTIANLTVNGEFDAPSFTVHDEQISDLSFKLDYANKNIYLETNSFLWKNQLSSIDGIFDLSKLDSKLHINTKPIAYNPDFNLTTDMLASVDLNSNNVSAEININQLGFVNDDMSFSGFQGFIKLDNPSGLNKNFEVDLEIKNKLGITISAIGNIGKQDLSAAVQLEKVSLQDYVAFAETHKFPLDLSGTINATLKNNLVEGLINLTAVVLPPHSMQGDIKTSFTYDLEKQSGAVILETENSSAKGIPFTLFMDAKLDEQQLYLNKFNLDDKLTASGRVNLRDFLDMDFGINADSIDIDKYWNMWFHDKPAPFSTTLAMKLDYSPQNAESVVGFLKIDSLMIQSVQPINAMFGFSGSANDILITGEAGTNDKNKVILEGSVALKPKITLKAKGSFENINLHEVLLDTPVSGEIRGDLSWQLNATSKPAKQEFSCNLTGSNINLDGIPIDSLEVNAIQTNNVLQVEQLFLNSQNLINLHASGALDYNLLTNNYTLGNNLLNLSIEGDVLRILKNYVPYFEVGKGRLKSQLAISTDDNGININSGTLSMSKGLLRMKDQVNPFEKINFEATVTNNILRIDTLSCQLGLGKIYIRNEIDAGDDNFNVGSLNLGYFLVHTDNQGVQVSIPEYLPPNTTVNAVLKGQNSKEATIKGPFDDMEFIAEATASNGSAVYPANTKNILQLVNVFQRKKDNDEILPLPFTLDLLVNIENNVKYVTYPASLLIKPKSFLRLTYDGVLWNAQEADFISENGTLDFYGTIFNVEFVQIEINAKRNILAVNGTFIKKAADGTLVTLRVLTNPQKGSDLLNQLEFKLSSDNPQDITQIQVLSRLRYSRNVEELSPDQRQTLLQDEAMQLVSTSVSTTYVSQFLSPIENRIRRFLRLDNFTITTGFVQNIFVEFTSNNDANTSFSDPNNLNTDIMQFSSSVLLNNLSVSMSKYIGNNVFLDYEIHLQETTDLAKKTKLDLYHNASVRLNIPWKLRLSYTFSIRPAREANSHEIMMQRSFRF